MATGIEQKILLEDNGFTVEVAVTENYDILTNTSNVTVGLRVKSAYVSGIQYLSGTLKLDGELLVDMDSTVSTHHVPAFSYNTWYDVVRSSDDYTDSPWTLKKIAHNTDGSKSVKLELEMRGYGEDNYLSFRVATTKTIPLTHIPRASTAGASDANIGAISTISVLRRSAAYRHSIAYKFGTLSGYVQADGSISSAEVKMTQTSIPFLLPESFYSQIPDKPTGTCVLTVKTYSGNNRIGEDQTARFTVTAAKSLCAPQVTGKVEDVNAKTVALTGDSNILVRYVSKAKCTITATAKNSASIASKEIGGVEVSGSSRQLDGVKTGSIVFACVDTRGYSASKTVKKTLVPYLHLTAGVAAGRKDPTSGKAWLTVTGNWFHGNFGAAENTLSVSYRINGGSSVAMEITEDGNTYTAEADLTGLDYQKSHTIAVTVTDKLETVTKSVSVGKGIPVFDWGEADFRFNVPVELSAGCEVLKSGAAAYAPAGWGYGGAMDYIVDELGTFETKLNEILAGMVNHSVKQFSFYDSKGLISKKFFGTLWKYTANYATLEAINYDGNKAIKCKYDGKWQPWEWVNPPMNPGVEYRTTERFEGEPVYCMLVKYTNASTIGSDSSLTSFEIPHGNSGINKLIRITGRQGGVYPVPGVTTKGGTYGVGRITSQYITLRMNNCAFDSRTWYFNIYYTK